MRQFIKTHWAYCTIAVLSLIVFLINLKPGFFLAGWDNLQTELHPTLAIKRAFFSVWEEYQSFGLVSGLAHGTDLIRAFVVWVMTWIMPTWMVRYAFHVAMLSIGAFGAYRLFQEVFGRRLPALAGALFYMLNLGTIQILYVPLESFSIFFAGLPWQMWIFYRLLILKGSIWKSKKLFWFILINLLFTAQSYVQTIFIVYVLILGCVGVGLALEERSTRLIGRSIGLGVLILLLNAFWLLPQIYSVSTSGDVVKESKINQLATDDTYYQNKQKGTLEYFVKLEGYYYDLYRTDRKPLFHEWKNHTNNPFITLITYALAGIALVGLFAKRTLHIGFVFVLALCALTLLTRTPPFEQLNMWLRQIDLVNQIFRSPFTKFVIPLALVYAYFVASGVEKLGTIKKFHAKKHLISYVVIALILIHALPVFQGYLFSPTLRVKFPYEYQFMMDYFKTQDKNKRIALLPDHTFWGWLSHRWGYDGSGFLWYGIEQPIVSRTFDPWSKKSENYFWEMKNAVEAENVDDFKNILAKYNIDYLLMDYSLLPVSATLRGLQYSHYEALFTRMTRARQLELIEKRGTLALYAVPQEIPVKSFVSVLSNPPNIGPRIDITSADSAYKQYGAYVTDPSYGFDAYVPFLNLTTQTRLPSASWSIREEKDYFIVEAAIPSYLNTYDLTGPASGATITYFDKEVKIQNVSFKSIAVKDGKIAITIPKKVVHDFNITKTEHHECGPVPGAIPCFAFDAPQVEQRFGYLAHISNINLEGRRYFFYVLDKTKKQSFVEDRLQSDEEYYLISPKYDQGVGYTMVFNTNSYSYLPSQNKLRNLTLYAFPINELRNLSFINPRVPTKTAAYLTSFSADKIAYHKYATTLSKAQNANYLVLNQSYHPGWKAYAVKQGTRSIERMLPFIFGEELNNHVLVNNWANGWDISPSQLKSVGVGHSQSKTADSNRFQLVILFWPQYLQYLGFFILFVTLLYIAFHAQKRQK